MSLEEAEDPDEKRAQTVLMMYRDRGSSGLDLLREAAEALAAAKDPAGAADRAGADADWLREQGEIVAAECARNDRLRQEQTVRDLAVLRRAFTQLGVSCAGQAVPEKVLAAAALDHARYAYGEAVTRASPYWGWKALQMQGEAGIQDMDDVAPGARDVVLGCAVRYLKEKLARTDRYGLPRSALENLEPVVQGLDGETVAALKAEGIPADAESIRHGIHVAETGDDWRHRHGESEHLFLAGACRAVLAERTVQASDIAAAEEEIWNAARDLMEDRARKVRDGDYDALHELTVFADLSRLGYGPFGITAAQVRGWELERVRNYWEQARDGDGRAAFKVIWHCAWNPGSWEAAAGQPEAAARPVLQEIMVAHAARLKHQVETAPSSAQAKQPLNELKVFLTHVRTGNAWFREKHGSLLAEEPWRPEPGEWEELCARADE